jgi:TonB-dependent SusC/RagA subfamily outer membrane receptor
MKKCFPILFLVFIGICFLSNLVHAQGRLPQGSYKTIYDMLKDVPGLEVTTNGGKAGSIIVRGISSLKSQQPPLFVVDQTVYNGDVMNINVQDVESISVLKDAASLTTYGAQGNAGVILITTKKGSTISTHPIVENYKKSAYSYFIEHKTNLKIIGLDDNTIIEGVIQKQVDTLLFFTKRRKEISVPIRLIKKVEMLPDQD